MIMTIMFKMETAPFDVQKHVGFCIVVLLGKQETPPVQAFASIKLQLSWQLHFMDLI